MKQIKQYNVDALKGFEGNHAHEIVDELEQVQDNILTELYHATNKTLELCSKCDDCPGYVMEHYSAMAIAIAQELTYRATQN